MTAHEARKILIGLKRQIRTGDGYRAIDKALQALAWQEIQERATLFDDGIPDDVPPIEEEIEDNTEEE